MSLYFSMSSFVRIYLLKEEHKHTKPILCLPNLINLLHNNIYFYNKIYKPYVILVDPK